MWIFFCNFFFDFFSDGELFFRVYSILSQPYLVLFSMFVGLELRTDEVCCWCSEENKVDHKIFIIQQKCNNTANIFVPEYIVVGDALTIGCAAEMKIYEYCIKQGRSIHFKVTLDWIDMIRSWLASVSHYSNKHRGWSRMSLLWQPYPLEF